MYNKVADITIEQVIKARIYFINHNDVFDKEEYKLYNEGEIRAYNEILKDIQNCLIDEFVNKYINILRDIQGIFESSKNNEEIEMLAGYNNAILFVMELIDPKYKYCDL